MLPCVPPLCRDAATCQHPLSLQAFLESRDRLPPASLLCIPWEVWALTYVLLPDWLSTCWMAVRSPAHADGPSVHLVQAFTFPLPQVQLSHVAGVPSKQMGRVTRVSERIGPRRGVSRESACWRVAKKEGGGGTVATEEGEPWLQSHPSWRTDGRRMANPSPPKPLEIDALSPAGGVWEPWHTLSEFTSWRNVRVDCSVQPASSHCMVSGVQPWVPRVPVPGCHD